MLEYFKEKLKKENLKNIFLFFLILIMAVLDVFLKNWILINVKEKNDIKFGIVKLTYLENYGAAFGIFKNFKILFIFLTFFCIFLFFYSISKNKFKKIFFCITVGAIGNLLDRLIFGFVIDYISLPFLPFVFNLSDFLITLGAGILFFTDFRKWVLQT